MVAVVALVGTLVTAIFPNWLAIYTDDLKRQRTTEQLLSKYRDPLLLATQDLQSSCWAVLNHRISKSKQVKEDAEKYTCYLWGQYLSWAYILRRKFQFLAFSLDKDNKDLARILGLIESIMTRNITGEDAENAVLWRYSQAAIGELMTLTDEQDEMRCMGYSDFVAKWDEQSSTFRRWFDPIQCGLDCLRESREPHEIGSASASRFEAPEQRFRLLQHSLLDLRSMLDPKGLRKDDIRNRYCEPRAKTCRCSHCKAQWKSEGATGTHNGTKETV